MDLKFTIKFFHQWYPCYESKSIWVFLVIVLSLYSYIYFFFSVHIQWLFFFFSSHFRSMQTHTHTHILHQLSFVYISRIYYSNILLLVYYGMIVVKIEYNQWWLSLISLLLYERDVINMWLIFPTGIIIVCWSSERGMKRFWSYRVLAGDMMTVINKFQIEEIIDA